MRHNFRYRHLSIASIVLALAIVSMGALQVSALTPLPTPDPQPGSYGIEATKKQAPPTRGATITTPGNGASFSESPITVSGICPNGLLVQVFNNGVMAGSVMCRGGSFSLDVSLFPGENELSALVYDDLDQAGPKSNTRTVRFTDTSFTDFGEQVTLTSSFGRRSAPTNNQLTWPLQLSGGTGPYAFSIDWGDGTPSELKSQATAGVVSIAHVYKRAGIYQVNIRVTDENGVTAFLQVISVASGKVDAAAGTGDDGPVQAAKPEVVWAPAALSAILLAPTFWLGRRSQLISLRNKMLKEQEAYKES